MFYKLTSYNKVLQRSSKDSLRGSTSSLRPGYTTPRSSSSSVELRQAWVDDVIDAVTWFNQSLRSNLFISYTSSLFRQANPADCTLPSRRVPMLSTVEGMKEGPHSSGIASVPIASTYLSCDLFQPFREPRITLPGVGWVARCILIHCTWARAD